MKIHTKFINLQNSCYKNQCKNDPNYQNLTGVRFDIVAMEAIATNGHHIVKLPITPEDLIDLNLTESKTIEFKDCKPIKNFDLIAFTKINNFDYAVLGSKGSARILEYQDYPMTDSFFDKDTLATKSFSFGISLAELNQLVKSLPSDKNQYIKISVNTGDNLASILVESNNIQGIVMPVRLDRM